MVTQRESELKSVLYRTLHQITRSNFLPQYTQLSISQTIRGEHLSRNHNSLLNVNVRDRWPLSNVCPTWSVNRKSGKSRVWCNVGVHTDITLIWIVYFVCYYTCSTTPVNRTADTVHWTLVYICLLLLLIQKSVSSMWLLLHLYISNVIYTGLTSPSIAYKVYNGHHESVTINYNNHGNCARP